MAVGELELRRFGISFSRPFVFISARRSSGVAIASSGSEIKLTLEVHWMFGFINGWAVQLDNGQFNSITYTT